MSYPYPPHGPNQGMGSNPADNMGFNINSSQSFGNGPPLPYSLNPNATSYNPYPPNPTGSAPYPPSQGGGVPYPPNSSGSDPFQTNPYGPFPPISQQSSFSTSSSPYPPTGSSPYPSTGSSPYPPTGSSPYPPTGSSAYPPTGSSPYPPTGSSPYSPSGSSAYPPSGSSAYPPTGSSPYPPTGSSAYPPTGSSAYPPTGSSPYPPTGSSPYPPSGSSACPPSGSSAYPPTGSSAYPPTGSSAYPNIGSSPYAPNPIGASPYAPPSSDFAPKMNASSFHSYASNMGSVHPHSTGAMMWPYVERPTLRPVASFDASGDAAALRKAMKGFGTDEKAIIQILGRRTSHERQQIKLKYQQAYGKDAAASSKDITGDLEKDLKSELSGQFENVVLGLMTPLTTYLANEMYKATQGIGTNENTLIEILCTSENQTLREIKSVYQTLYKRPIEKDLKGDTSGDFKRLVVSLATASRDEQGDTSIAPSLAQSLYKAGEKKKFGTNEEEFNRILCVYSYPVLRCTFEEYRKISGKTFEASIRSETSGDFKDGLLALYSCIMNRAAFFATELHNAMKGLGTKDNALIRIIISRSEIDMGNIKDEYYKAYGKRLDDAISSETSGDYKKILLALIQG